MVCGEEERLFDEVATMHNEMTTEKGFGASRTTSRTSGRFRPSFRMH